MEKSRNTVRGIVHQPVLNRSDTVTQHIRVQRLLARVLRKMTESVRNQLRTFFFVQISEFVKKIIHVSAPELGDTFLLRHPVVKFIDILLHIDSITACH